MVIPSTEIGFAVPTFLLLNVAVALLWSRETSSSVSTPTRAAESLASCKVAFSVAS